MDFLFLTNTALFRGSTEQEAQAMLNCLGSFSRSFGRGELICRAGQSTRNLGLILSGSVTVENDDVWGNRSILEHLPAGQIFAETYACIPGEPLLVNVAACEKSEILFLDASRLLTTCPNSCAHHNRVIQNLLQISARQNLALSRRILHTSAKSIRGRLLSYLSQQAQQNGGYQFTIPLNRQQLADYLSVDRSALSNELSRMQSEGLLSYERNRFSLKQQRQAPEP